MKIKSIELIGLGNTDKVLMLEVDKELEGKEIKRIDISSLTSQRKICLYTEEGVTICEFYISDNTSVKVNY